LDLPADFVSNSTYWLVDESNQVLSAVNVRHDLNEKRLLFGGHIGYGIRSGAKVTRPKFYG